MGLLLAKLTADVGMGQLLAYMWMVPTWGCSWSSGVSSQLHMQFTVKNFVKLTFP
jgi:hypothetical protein